VFVLLPLFPHVVRAGTDDKADQAITALAAYVERLGPQQVLPVAADKAAPAAARAVESASDTALTTGNPQSQSDWLAQHKLAMAKSLAGMNGQYHGKQGDVAAHDWLAQHRQAVSQSFAALSDYVRRMAGDKAAPQRSERPLSPAARPLLQLAERANPNFWNQGSTSNQPPAQTDTAPTTIETGPTTIDQGNSTKPLDTAAPSDETSSDQSSEDQIPLNPWSDPNATYVGSQVCMGCHFDKAEQFGKTPMGRVFLQNPRTAQEKLGCEACHGPGSDHVQAGGGRNHAIVSFRVDSPLPIKQRNGVCLNCHEDTHRNYWRGSVHQRRGLACTNCHQVHQQHGSIFVKATEIETCFQCHKDKRAKLLRFSRHPLLEGKMTCSSCHNPHGSPTPKLLVQASVNETCYQCHADKRGPFLWEHAPVRENCTTCHDPHGTSNFALLKMQVPRLCQQCHANARHPSQPQNPLSRFAFDRGCLNCHGAIHGSNSPSGVRFQR